MKILKTAPTAKLKIQRGRDLAGVESSVRIATTNDNLMEIHHFVLQNCHSRPTGGLRGSRVAIDSKDHHNFHQFRIG